jgi:DNA-binding NtrC family response regulator
MGMKTVPQHPRACILLVDDDIPWREELGGLLRDQGYRVETAASKEEAQKCFGRGEERRGVEQLETGADRQGGGLV